MVMNCINATRMKGKIMGLIDSTAIAKPIKYRSEWFFVNIIRAGFEVWEMDRSGKNNLGEPHNFWWNPEIYPTAAHQIKDMLQSMYNSKHFLDSVDESIFEDIQGIINNEVVWT